ncbi:MAG: hypothetical protein ACKVI4_18090, partial [Actinomycetales bacterium]
TPETVTSLSPASGATTGDTLVRVSGADLQPFKERLCMFGAQNHTVAAQWTSTGEYRCVSLPSSVTNATTRLALDFSSAASLEGYATLFSLAPSDDVVREGHLVMTEAQTSHERTMIMELPALWELERYFELTFDLRVEGGGRNGGEGVSVCFGDLPEVPFGEEGAGDGLRVLLRTRAARFEVYLGDGLVLGRPLDVSLVREQGFVPV